jgi:hypothetical protein
MKTGPIRQNMLFYLSKKGTQNKLIFTQNGISENKVDALKDGWKKNLMATDESLLNKK